MAVKKTTKKASPEKKAVKKNTITTGKKATGTITKKAASTAKKVAATATIKKASDTIKKPVSNTQVEKLKAENAVLKARVKELEKLLKDTVKNINKAL